MYDRNTSKSSVRLNYKIVKLMLRLFRCMHLTGALHDLSPWQQSRNGPCSVSVYVFEACVTIYINQRVNNKIKEKQPSIPKQRNCSRIDGKRLHCCCCPLRTSSTYKPSDIKATRSFNAPAQILYDRMHTRVTVVCLRASPYSFSQMTSVSTQKSDFWHHSRLINPVLICIFGNKTVLLFFINNSRTFSKLSKWV